jgi:predicted neutral ceramidase superfamily lipid hydrolase
MTTQDAWRAGYDAWKAAAPEHDEWQEIRDCQWCGGEHDIPCSSACEAEAARRARVQRRVRRECAEHVARVALARAHEALKRASGGDETRVVFALFDMTTAAETLLAAMAETDGGDQ